ncbi:alkyl sulfatase dimerization domain-containing protein [Streptomyces canus]|uniref:alkyl sulfatase dimerization domain-containing protein n=1 Tax=Streptomyces canus TaxID=58343 RepID=UPI0033D926FE
MSSASPLPLQRPAARRRQLSSVEGRPADRGASPAKASTAWVRGRRRCARPCHSVGGGAQLVGRQWRGGGLEDVLGGTGARRIRVQLPDSGSKGQLSFSVQAPTVPKASRHQLPAPARRDGSALRELMGCIDAVVAHARTAHDTGEDRWAAELLKHALAAGPPVCCRPTARSAGASGGVRVLIGRRMRP